MWLDHLKFESPPVRLWIHARVHFSKCFFTVQFKILVLSVLNISDLQKLTNTARFIHFFYIFIWVIITKKRLLQEKIARRNKKNDEKTEQIHQENPNCDHWSSRLQTENCHTGGKIIFEKDPRSRSYYNYRTRTAFNRRKMRYKRGCLGIFIEPNNQT